MEDPKTGSSVHTAVLVRFLKNSNRDQSESRELISVSTLY